MTQEEKIQINQVAMDLESGNHLLRPRTREYLKFLREVAVATETVPQNRTDRQRELVDAYDECFYQG